MKTTLLALIFNKTMTLLPKFQQNLGEEVLKFAVGVSACIHCAFVEINVADIESGAIQVGGIFGRIDIALLESANRFICA